MLRSMHAIRSIFRSPVFELTSNADLVRGSSLTVWAFAFCAIVAAVVALPTDKEIAYGLIADRNFNAARARLIDIHAKGNGDLHSAIALHEVHLRFGDLDRADKVIQSALEAHANNVELHKKAARFYKHVQEPAKRLRTLVRILNIKPSSEVLDEALQLLRLHGNYEGEKAVLVGLADSPVLSAAHHARLGYIFAREQNHDQAASHLERANTMSAGPDWSSRMGRFRILLSQQHFSRSEALVKQWLADKTGNDQLAFLYSESISTNRTQLAQTILKEAVLRGHISRDDAVQLQRGGDE